MTLKDKETYIDEYRQDIETKKVIITRNMVFKSKDVKEAVLEFENRIKHISRDYKEITNIHKEIFGDFKEE
jgi:two-component sensor histidine kinase